MRFNFSLSFIKCFFATIFSILFLLSIDTFAQTPYPSHNSGTKLLETVLYELYADTHNADAQESSIDSNGCEANGNSARSFVNLVFKVDSQFKITDQTVFKNLFEKEIFPILRDKCNPKSVRVNVYIKNVRIGAITNQEYNYSDNLQEKEKSFYEVLVNIYPKQFVYFSGIFDGLILADSLADFREKQEDKSKIKEGKGFHYATIKIKETELYELYGGCGIGISLVLKVTPDYLITQATLEKIVEKELVPILEQKCGNLNSLSIGLYIKGVRIGSNSIGTSSQEYNYNQLFPNDVIEIPLIGIKVYINKQQKFPYLYERSSFQIASLADYRKINAKSRMANIDKKYSENLTSDGKLNLINLSIESKKLFHQIYNGEFAELATPNKDEYIPYGLFPGLIANYSEMCRSSLSPSAIKVDEYAKRYLGTEYIGLSKTRYYEKY